jgi:hypothetical protein
MHPNEVPMAVLLVVIAIVAIPVILVSAIWKRGGKD